VADLALIADIHGNLPALEAVLADIQAQDVGAILCLGDVALFGPQPNACLERLQALGCAVVMGNTDAWALDPHPLPRRNADSARIEAIERWGAVQLGPRHKAYIRSFRPTVRWALAPGTTLLAYHGSPRSFHDSIQATTPESELDRCFQGQRAQLLAGGHTHRPFLRRYRDAWLLNPGSVGLPLEISPVDGAIRHPAHAEYARVRIRGAALAVEFRRIPYALDRLVAAVQASHMPHGDWWLARWMAAPGGQEGP